MRDVGSDALELTCSRSAICARALPASASARASPPRLPLLHRGSAPGQPRPRQGRSATLPARRSSVCAPRARGASPGVRAAAASVCAAAAPHERPRRRQARRARFELAIVARASAARYRRLRRPPNGASASERPRRRRARRGALRGLQSSLRCRQPSRAIVSAAAAASASAARRRGLASGVRTRLRGFLGATTGLMGLVEAVAARRARARPLRACRPVALVGDEHSVDRRAPARVRLDDHDGLGLNGHLYAGSGWKRMAGAQARGRAGSRAAPTAPA